MVRLVALLAVALIIASGAAAAPVGSKTIDAPWMFTLPDEAGLAVNGTGARLVPLGDADGDGLADIAVGQVGQEEIHALAGPDLETIIWSMDSPIGLMPAGDLNGDGVLDVLGRFGFDFQGSWEGAGAGGAYASVSETEISFRLTVHDGTDASELVSVADVSTATTASASLFASGGPAYALLMLGGGEGSYSGEALPGPEQKWRIEAEGAHGSATTFSPAGYQSTRQSLPETISFTRTTFADQDQFTLTFDDARRVLLSGDFMDVTGDGIADLVLMDVPRPADVDGTDVAYGADGVHAYDGASGELLWSVMGEDDVHTVEYRYVFFEPLGDVDGDGAPDLGRYDVTYGATSMQARSDILSGQDGSVLLAVSAAEGALPFGDINGDGTQEFIMASEAADGYSLTVRDLETEHWSTTVSQMSQPINLEGDFNGYRFSDLTGDGAPDIMLWDWDEDPWYDDEASASFSLIDGQDGQVAWEREVGPILNAALLDATGDGTDDLLLMRGVDEDGSAVGYAEGSNHTVRLDLYDGRDGRSVWGRVMLDPDVAGDRALYEMDGYMMRAGDIDGDGGEDALLSLWNGCDYFLWVDDGDVSYETDDCEIYQQHVVVSGRAADVLMMLPESNASADGKDALPAVEQGEAFQGAVDDGKESPMPLLVAIGAILLALRRRR